LAPLSALRVTTLSFARNRKAQGSSTTPGAADKSYRALREIHGSFPNRKQLQGVFWTLADQGAISLGTFLLNLQLARQLDVSEYGTFALLLGGYFLVQHFNTSLIHYPLILRLTGKEERTSDLILISVALTAASSFAFSAIMVACLSAFGRPDIAAAAALYLLLWQLQDLLRRTLLAEFRHRAAIICYCRSRQLSQPQPGDGAFRHGWRVRTSDRGSSYSTPSNLPKHQRTAGVAADFLATWYLDVW
jgi:hypothetical protein